MNELINSSLFEGQDDEKYFSHDVSSLDDGKYRMAGILVAMSISQDGPGLHCLNTALYELMAGLEPDMSLATIPLEIQDMIAEVYPNF